MILISTPGNRKQIYGGTGRYGAVGFSIGNKGYLGTGQGNGGFYSDFWEYDPASNVWTQKADYSGGPRRFATGFSIGTKGYIGTGFDGSNARSDFWEFDSYANIWTKKSDFGGGNRSMAAAFSIGQKGYIGTGMDYTVYYGGYFYITDYSDLGEYDPFFDSWSKRADFEGYARSAAVSLSIDSKGYIGTGIDKDYNYFKDFWEYDPSLDTWIQKIDFGGGIRRGAAGFSIGSKGYLGTGYKYEGGYVYCNDFWEYDPEVNTWTEKIGFAGNAREGAVGFSISNKGYLGTGKGSEYPDYYKDFWEYTPELSIPACNFLTTLSTINITPITAKLKWIGINEALSYKIRYKPTGTSEWTITKSKDNHKTIIGLSPSTEYTWQVKSFCDIQPVVSSDWSEKQFFTTDELRFSESTIYENVFQVYPNPVSQSAVISFSISEASSVMIELMDVNGRSVSVIAHKDFSAGSHEVTFSVRSPSDNRASLPAGIYFLQLKTREGVMMKKIALE